MSELHENLKVRNSAVKNAKSMTRGEETETAPIEFNVKDILKELLFGCVKPVRCFICKEYGHVAKVCKVWC